MEKAGPCTGNLVLIGMSGAGKTLIAKWFMQNTAIPTIDTDELMISEIGLSQWKKLAFSYDDFLDLEEKTIRLLKVSGTLISTGGSVIYRETIMKRLRSLGRIVFLDASLDTLKKRVGGSIHSRGIVGLGTHTYDELFRIRHPLYEKYADFKVNANGEDHSLVAREVLKIFESLKK